MRYAAGELPECFWEPDVPVIVRQRQRGDRGDVGDRCDHGEPLLDLDAELYVEILAGTVSVHGRAVCPLHAPIDDENPSLVCDGRLWACHSSGCTPSPGSDVAGGSIVDFAARLWNVEPRGAGYWEIRRRIAETLGAWAREV